MINDLFERKYSPQKYHCVHFVIESAKLIFKSDYSACFIGLTGSLDESIKTSRDTVHKNKRIENRGLHCAYDKVYNGSHVGLYYKGRIFHLSQPVFSALQPQAAKTQYKRIRFYEPNLHN